jgi:hypothetical protein
MPQAWPRQCEGARQGAERSVGIVFSLERGTAINLLLQKCLLDAFEKLFGLGQGQAAMRNAVAVFVQRHDIGHGLLMAIIAAQDELECDTHDGVSPG